MRSLQSFPQSGGPAGLPDAGLAWVFRQEVLDAMKQLVSPQFLSGSEAGHFALFRAVHAAFAALAEAVAAGISCAGCREHGAFKERD